MVGLLVNVIRKEGIMWLHLIAWVVFLCVATYIVCLGLLFGEFLVVILGVAMSIFGANRIGKETDRL